MRDIVSPHRSRLALHPFPSCDAIREYTVHIREMGSDEGAHRCASGFGRTHVKTENMRAMFCRTADALAWRHLQHVVERACGKTRCISIALLACALIILNLHTYQAIHR